MTSTVVDTAPNRIWLRGLAVLFSCALIAALVVAAPTRPADAADGDLFDLFDGHASSDNLTNTYLLSLLGHYAYEPNVPPSDSANPDPFNARIVNAMNALGLTNVDPIGSGLTNTEGFIAETDDAVIVSFRGTEFDLCAGLTDLHACIDIIIDVSGVFETTLDGTHGGFRLAASSVLPQVVAALNAAGGKPVWITGHSLGAAVAQDVAYQLRDQYDINGVVNFGEPHLYQRGLAWGLYETHPLRQVTELWINNEDPVPHAVGAFESLVDVLTLLDDLFGLDLLLFNYTWVGDVHHIAVAPNDSCSVGSGGPLLGLDMADHDTKRYSTRILNQMPRSHRNALLMAGTSFDYGVDGTITSPPLPPVDERVADCDQEPQIEEHTITPIVTGTEGLNGWYTSSVDVSWDISGEPPDPINSLDCDDVELVGNTSGTVVECVIEYIDIATLQTYTRTESVTIKIDISAPTISLDEVDEPNANGWYTEPFSVSWTGTDTGSGIFSCTERDYSGPDTANRVIVGVCRDKAGNRSDFDPYVFKYDATAPSGVSASAGRAPDANGWYNAAVAVNWSGDDATSGIDTCTNTTYNGPDTATASLAGTCTDNAGNTSTTTSLSLAYDATAPIIDIGSPGDGASYLRDEVVVADYGCSDATSGVDGCDGTVAHGAAVSTSAFGTFPFTVNAVDEAGNTSTATHQYSVSYALGEGGFEEPQQALPEANVVNAGSRVPLRWMMIGTDDLPVVDRADLFEVHWSEPFACDAPPTLTGAELAAGVAVRWDAETEQYIANAKSGKRWTDTCRYLVLDIVGGGRAGVLVEFK